MWFFVCFSLLHIFSETIDVFSDFTKKTLVAFWQTLFNFQTLHDHNLVWGLAVHTRFDNLDLILRSQVFLNHKLQIVLRSLLTVMLYGGYTHIKMVKYSMLCDWCIFKKHNTSFVILHWNVSHLSICYSCFIHF